MGQIIDCKTWYEGEEGEAITFPEAPVVGDIVRDTDGEFYRVASRQWDVEVARVVLNLHLEVAEVL